MQVDYICKHCGEINRISKFWKWFLRPTLELRNIFVVKNVESIMQWYAKTVESFQIGPLKRNNILYEVIKMTIEAKKLLIEGRINLLQARGSHNDRIVNKLKRRLRNLDK